MMNERNINLTMGKTYLVKWSDDSHVPPAKCKLIAFDPEHMEWVFQPVGAGGNNVKLGLKIYHIKSCVSEIS